MKHMIENPNARGGPDAPEGYEPVPGHAFEKNAEGFYKFPLSQGGHLYFTNEEAHTLLNGGPIGIQADVEKFFSEQFCTTQKADDLLIDVIGKTQALLAEAGIPVRLRYVNIADSEHNPDRLFGRIFLFITENHGIPR